MNKATGGAAHASEPEVRVGPAADQTEVQRLEVLYDESTYAVERIREKVSKAEERLKDAKAAYAEAQGTAKTIERRLAAARRQEG